MAQELRAIFNYDSCWNKPFPKEFSMGNGLPPPGELAYFFLFS
jgi:hypothetical protein